MGDQIAANATRMAFRRSPEFINVFQIIHPLLILNMAVILLLCIILWCLFKSRKRQNQAIEILKSRYAAGDIDRETYARMKSDIMEKESKGD